MPVRHTGTHPPVSKKQPPPARRRGTGPSDEAIVVALLRFKQASKDVVEKSRQLKRASERLRVVAAALNKLMAQRSSKVDAENPGSRRKGGGK